MKHFIISLFILTLFTSYIRSQTDSATYNLPEFKLSQKSKYKEDTYIFKRDYNKLILYNDTLYDDPSIYKYRVGLNNISEVSFRDGTYSVPGFVYAAAGGFIIGFIAGISLPEKTIADGESTGSLIKGNFASGMLLGVVLALFSGGIGSLVGLMTPYYEDYELHKTDLAKKRSGLKKVFNFWNIPKK